MKRTVVLTLAVLLVGCTQVASPEQTSSTSVISGIQYVRDERVGICYAVVASHNGHFGNVASITAVPCEKVEQLIKK
jgi:hypothetical protein